jgi:hypothetical protein
MDFDTFRKEALAAMLTTTAQDSPACLGLHAGAEPELLFARALGRLVCAFHKIFKSEARRLVRLMATSTEKYLP